MQDVLFKSSLLYFTTCIILYCGIVRIKESDYLFSASICVTSPLFVTLLRTFLCLIQKAWFPMGVERKNMIARLYREKPKAKNEGFFSVLSFPSFYLCLCSTGMADNVGSIFISHYFPSMNTRLLYGR